MLIEALEHIQLAMPAGQENVARGFYSGLLEIPEVPKPSHLIKRGGVWFESGQVKLHLGIDPDFRPAKKAHPGLLVRNLTALVLKLQAAGIAVIDAEPLPGYDHVYIADPFGNRIELMEPAAIREFPNGQRPGVLERITTHQIERRTRIEGALTSQSGTCGTRPRFRGFHFQPHLFRDLAVIIRERKAEAAEEPSQECNHNPVD